jgi:hypothetical protein
VVLLLMMIDAGGLCLRLHPIGLLCTTNDLSQDFFMSVFVYVSAAPLMQKRGR